MNRGLWRILVPLGMFGLIALAGCSSGGGGGGYSYSNSPTPTSSSSGGDSVSVGVGAGHNSPGLAWVGALVAMGSVAGILRNRRQD